MTDDSLRTGVERLIAEWEADEVSNRFSDPLRALLAKHPPDHQLHAQCHDLVCNGDRSKPRGTRGVTCSCRDRSASPPSAPSQVTLELLSKEDGLWVRLGSPDGQEAWINLSETSFDALTNAVIAETHRRLR